jgi:hypothetical protein
MASAIDPPGPLVENQVSNQRIAAQWHLRYGQGRRRSAELTGEYTERFALAETVVELQRIGGELRPALKAQLAAKDLERVRRAYALRLAALHTPAAEPARNGA